MPHVIVHPEVTNALNERRPVVALETAVLTHGLPRTPLRELDASRLPDAPAPGWDVTAPLNLEVARAVGRVVRAGGAVPATVGVIRGALRIGMDTEEIAELAGDPDAGKAAADNLAHFLADGGTAGTTVSATLIACSRATPAPIRVLATGGIGGVHREWTTRPDVSADLRVLGNVQACVVCAGAKSILDLPATLEMLQSLGVPVLGHRTSWFPRFQARGTNDLPLRQRVDDARAAADVCRAHWNELAQRTAVLLTVDVPEPFAVDAVALERETLAAERDGVTGAARTPHLLDALAQRTAGRTVVANIALLLNNAGIATRLSTALADP